MIIRFSSKIFSAILLFGFAAFSASASTYTVTNTKDSGAGSLREAAVGANLGIFDVINFNIASTDPNCVGGVCTITLTTGEILLDLTSSTQNLAITNQSGAKNLIISGNNLSRIFNIKLQSMHSGMSVDGITFKSGLGNGSISVETIADAGNQPTLTISNSVFSNNKGQAGGGIYSLHTLLSIVKSTFNDNRATLGGGIFCETSKVNITNSTFSGGFAQTDGGGVYNNAGSVTITNTTIAGNGAFGSNSSSGGIANHNDSYTMTFIRNTIVAGNNALGSPRDISHGSADTFTSLGNNLIGSSGNTGTSVAWKSSDVLDQSSGLAPLGDNGGTTPTQALLANSRALNAGTNCVLTANGCGDSNAAITTDQRGSARKSGAAVDIGAFELQSNAQFNFDGDSNADLSVFRPSDTNWYEQRSTAGFSVVSWGLATDKLVPADFDGDGKTDTAVYRNGYWYLLRSSDNAFQAYNFGNSTDIPVPADFDGDGKADVNVYRPSDGTWYRLNSSNGQFVASSWGIAEDKPIIGDFDGDGKADLCVYRPSTFSWYRLNSSNGQFVANSFGAAGDLLVPADYDGDGKTDIAVFRPSNGDWYRLNSSTGQFAAVSWGLGTDKPVPADYDGDGKADVAVYRNGYWYIIQSSNSQIGYGNFGQAGDVPIPNVYVK